MPAALCLPASFSKQVGTQITAVVFAENVGVWNVTYEISMYTTQAGVRWNVPVLLVLYNFAVTFFFFGKMQMFLDF